MIPDKFLKSLIYIILSLSIILIILIQPYNLICKTSNKCHPIFLSSLIPHKKGQEKLFFTFNAQIPKELENKIEFYPKYKELEAVSGKNIINFYKLKNLSDKEMSLQAHYNVNPKEIDKYLNRIECLCFQRQKLKAGQEVEMKINFRIKSEIEKSEIIKNLEKIEVSYRIFYGSY